MILEAALRRLAEQAGGFDHSEADARLMMQPLVEAGALRAALPPPHGSGLATDPDQTLALHELLRQIGGANLSVGRLFEGHVNAVKLVGAFGSEAQRRAIANDVADGALMGVWNAETPPGLSIEGPSEARRFRGAKIYASGVGLLDRPLITARDETGALWMTVPKSAAKAPHDLSGWRMRGMRATATGTVDLTGLPLDPEEVIGAAGDYYRTPGFRGGAWRFATVQFGAVEEIARLMAVGLRARGRVGDPHQQSRMGQAAIAVETARLWTERAAVTVEMGGADAARADAFGGMARLVVERAALEVIQLAERSLGLMAFAEAQPIERLVRDLSTYLRQPFPDAVLEGVGDWALDTAQ